MRKFAATWPLLRPGYNAGTVGSDGEHALTGIWELCFFFLLSHSDYFPFKRRHGLFSIGIHSVFSPPLSLSFSVCIVE